MDLAPLSALALPTRLVLRAALLVFAHARGLVALDPRAGAASLAAVRGAFGDHEEPVDDDAFRALLVHLLPIARAPADALGSIYEASLPVAARRSAGAHYTPRALGRTVVARALAPLVADESTPDDVLAIRACDPAMGGGAFVLAAADELAEHLARSRAGRGEPLDHARALRDVALACVHGVDRDALAVLVARASLWLHAARPGDPLARFGEHLVHGDALVGAPWLVAKPIGAPRDAPSLDWAAAFPDVFARAPPGFDAFFGNPPWISYAGRAAQPLDPGLRALYLGSPAFAGYRNLQALFVVRAATLLRAGGRLGFVLPTSMSDLAGYAPSRRAHDELCEVERELPDFEDGGFDGVFQPCMGLFSTKRARPITIAKTAIEPWPLHRADLDARDAAILERLAARPKLPSSLFGERGFQSTGRDAARLRAARSKRHTLALRAGSDIEAFRRKPPSFHCDPRDFGDRLRTSEAWAAVRVLIRQTARFPIAALSDGGAFRNSILAGFEDARYTRYFLVAYLNSTPLRFVHFLRHRDARQGMPQLKIGHLRAIPAPAHDDALAALHALGERVGRANAGVTVADQEAIDRAAARALDFTDAELARAIAWASRVRERAAEARVAGERA